MAGTDYYGKLRSQAPKANKLIFFATWTKSWVANKTWMDDLWHYWGVAMLDNPTGRGKHLIVYDCEATMDQDFTQLRARSFMLPTQVKFIEWAKGYYRIQSIWYGNAAITPPEPNRCVHHTVTWIHAFASQLEAEYSGPEDHRLDGFALVHL